MEYKYWGYIWKHDDGAWTESQNKDESQPKPIDPCQLPEEFKTKIAMMDFMNNYDKLPCGSNKIYFSGFKLLVYFLYIEVSSTREHSEGA